MPLSFSLPPPPITLPGGDPSSTTDPTSTSTTAPADTTTSDTSTSTSDTSTTSTSTTSSTSTTPTSTSTTDTTTSTSTTPTSTSTSTSTTSTSTSTTSTTSTSTTSTSSTSTSTSSTPTSTTTSTSATTPAGVSTTVPGTSTTPSVVLATHTSLQTTMSNGQLTTVTNVVVATGTYAPSAGNSLPASTATPSHAAVPFLHNTAAVAGTFSAVGIIALIALFFAGTAFLRRRRERRFDDEADAAAAEAYKSAAGHQPYLDDDEDDFPGAARSAYTEHSGASLAQPPLVPAHGESYGMREFAPDPGAYGAAGLGAGAGANAALQRARSQKSAGDASQYTAYAASSAGDWQYGGPQDPYAAAAYPLPHAQPYAHAGYAPEPPQMASHQDLLASAGLDAPVRPSSAAAAAQQRGVALARSPSQAVTVHAGAGALHRNKSITLEQGFLDASAPGQYMPAQQAQYMAHGPQHATAGPYADVYGGADPYATPTPPAQAGGRTPEQQRRSHYEFDGLQPEVGYMDDDVASVRSADPPARVLRVANE